MNLSNHISDYSPSVIQNLENLEYKIDTFNYRLLSLKTSLFNRTIIKKCSSQLKNLKLLGKVSLDYKGNILFHHDDEDSNKESHISSYIDNFNQCYKANSYGLTNTELDFIKEVENISNLTKKNINTCIESSNNQSFLKRQDCIESFITHGISTYYEILGLYNAKLLSIENMII